MYRVPFSTFLIETHQAASLQVAFNKWNGKFQSGKNGNGRSGQVGASFSMGIPSLILLCGWWAQPYRLCELLNVPFRYTKH